jgi:hypothetical protein
MCYQIEPDLAYEIVCRSSIFMRNHVEYMLNGQLKGASAEIMFVGHLPHIQPANGQHHYSYSNLDNLYVDTAHILTQTTDIL